MPNIKTGTRKRKTPRLTGYELVRINKAEVMMLKYTLKKHANDLRDSAASMSRLANCLEAIGDHVQRLTEPDPLKP